MRKMFVGLLIFTLMLGVSSIGFAHGGHHGGGCGGYQYYDYNGNKNTR